MLDTRPLAKDRERRVGIFGVGEGGRKVLNAVVMLDCRLEWLSDNNPRTHGRTRGGIEVIAPSRIPASPVDAIVIGSVHRDAIRADLIAMGVDPTRVFAPNVSQSDEDLVDELRRLFDQQDNQITRGGLKTAS